MSAEWANGCTLDSSTCRHRTGTSRISLPQARAIKRSSTSKAKPSIRLRGRQASSEIAVKKLESTLSVAQSRDREQPHREIERTTHEVSVSRLPLLDAASVEGPGADGDPTGKGLVQRLDLFDGCGHVGVTEQNDFALCGGETRSHGRAFALVAVVNQTAEGDAGGKVGRTCNLRGLIARSVIHHEDLCQTATLDDSRESRRPRPGSTAAAELRYTME